jgi:hypothetical protein
MLRDYQNKGLCKAIVEWGPDFDNAFVKGHYQMSKESFKSMF